jgi:acyl-coenzyme A synthetase/AMP-(fatty) acid ligase
VAFIVSRFAEWARRQPRQVALIWRHSTVSYGELYLRAGAVQSRVDRLGLDPTAPVAVRAIKSPDAVALVLALLASGRPVLLPPIDLARPTLAGLTAAAGCVATLSTDPVPPPGTDIVITPRADEGGELRVAARPESVGFMLTASGCTGLPKIVPLTMAAVGAFAHWAADRFAIRPQRTVLSYAPMSFDTSLLDIWATLSAGGRVVLVDAELATRAPYLCDLLERHRVEVIQSVPMLFQLLLDHGRPVPSATHVISTGDALSSRLLSGLPKAFPNARCYNLYGCTETNSSFLHEIGPADAAPLPIGAPIDGVDALLVDRSGGVLPGAGVGELLVSTPFQTAGYLGAASTRFGPHPTAANPRQYFSSGDLVRRHRDGSMTLEGRADFQVKVRGIRVNTQAIEQVLLEHAGIAQAIVFAAPDPVAGNVLHAVVHRGAGVHTLAVRAHCAGLLPRAAIPTAIHLVDEPLPTTSTGKPDRARIKRTYTEKQT